MITRRPSDQRGTTKMGWLDSKHAFSFGSHYDPSNMGYSVLRVINDDLIAEGGGFSPHRHDEMEIVSIVTEGALAHKDSTGSESTMTPGMVQRMTAGTGIRHSEFNAHPGTTRLLQIWITPATPGLAPSYEEREFPSTGRQNALQWIVAPGGEGGALTIHQDARIALSDLTGDAKVTHPIAGRRGWVQVIEGAVAVNGVELGAGDAATIEREDDITIAGEGRVVLFDLP